MEFFAANIIPGEVIVQLVAFVIVFLVLRRFAWKPILGGLEHRRKSIREDLEKIEAARREIETLKKEYSGRLDKIEEEARSKIQEAIEEGRRIAREVQEKARKESQATFEKAKENLGIEVAKARVEFRQEIAGLALQATERILQETMADNKKQNEKVLEIIEELEKSL